MKKLFAVCALFLFTALSAQAAEFPYKKAVECTPRGGMPNFMAKLKAGKQVNILYLGGSITAQNGWRILSEKWFQKQYPKAKVKGISAAIGGTGSDLGVFRLKGDVLEHKPDLLFVEFAVNDYGAPPERIKRCMEGIVRQTWKAYPDCDICFVYTITTRSIKNLQAGKLNRSDSVMEDVANHYNIPSIQLGLKVAQMVGEGKVEMVAKKGGDMTRVSGDELNMKSDLMANKNGKIPFAKDGVHPYTDTGHKLYMEAIIRSMDSIEKAGKVGPHTLGAPLVAKNYEQAKSLPLAKAAMNGKWTEQKPSSKPRNLAHRFKGRMKPLWKGEPGATLKFKFKGTKVAIYDLVGPDCGYLEYTIDGKTKKARRFDRYCTYHRLSQLSLGNDLEDKEHTVEIKVLDKKFDKKSILSASKRADVDKRPHSYAGTNWYAGKIFIIGDLIEDK